MRKAGRPKKRPAQQATRDRILKIARKIFAERGYHLASLDEVADAVNIRVPSLLYHFPTKQDLYQEVVRDLSREINALLDRVNAVGGTPSEKFQRALQELTEFESRERAIVPIVLADSFTKDSPARNALVDLVAPLLDRVEEYFRQTLKPEIAKNAPLRQVIVMMLLEYASRSVLGSASRKIWGPDDQSLAIGMTLVQAMQKWPAK